MGSFYKMTTRDDSLHINWAWLAAGFIIILIAIIPFILIANLSKWERRIILAGFSALLCAELYILSLYSLPVSYMVLLVYPSIYPPLAVWFIGQDVNLKSLNLKARMWI